LLESNIDANPFIQFQNWLKESVESGNLHSNAMTLSTADDQNVPSSRIVLLKDISHEGFTFFTNYASKKSDDLKRNNNASLLFFWEAFERQVRILGNVKMLDEQESTDYFKLRPRDSQVAAWASQQSAVIDNRNVLDEAFAYYNHQFKNNDVPKPPHWGGYVLVPTRIEFWQGRANRLHDRIQYKKENNNWLIERLAP
jgi:pyridoxamine 5'-phosphate oxidase